jgi:hypothetical protein
MNYELTFTGSYLLCSTHVDPYKCSLLLLLIIYYAYIILVLYLINDNG